MSIEAFMKRFCKNTAVYWSTPTSNNDGSNSYAAPVEISCFWREKLERLTDNNGDEVISKATVYILQDLDEQGMLFLGELTDLTQAQKDNPRTVARAYEVKRFLKTPSMYLNGEFNRRALL